MTTNEEFAERQLVANVRLAVLSCNVTLDHANKATDLIVDAAKHYAARLTECGPESVIAACRDFRDCVLHGRHQLEAPCLDNDQTNAVLSLFDDTIGALLAALTQEKE